MDAKKRPDADIAMTDRIVFVANGVEAPSLLLSFIEPLKAVAGVEVAFISESDLRSDEQETGSWRGSPVAIDKLRKLLDEFAPSLIVFCRYSGPSAPDIIEWARAARTPTVYHIDDNLLQVPKEIGAEKARYHNEPRRLQTVRYLLDNTTLAYCSNDRLRRGLFGDTVEERIFAGEIYCASDILAPPTSDEAAVIGYMGLGSHDFDFTCATPALMRILDARQDVRLEIFGTIQLPEALTRFRDRIRLIEPVRDYGRFLEKLASLRWKIGICPLARSTFNSQKSNTKWVEYSACGFAVVASRGLIYDDCCADGCGLLVDGDDEWFAALDRLLADKTLHRDQVERAQRRVREDYSRDRLRQQIFSVFSRARALASRPEETNLSLDEFDGASIWGWAWRSSETSSDPQRRSLEIWCGDVLFSHVARRHDRPDADAYLGAAAWPKGFAAPVGALNALCQLMGGEGGAFHPTIRFHQQSASALAHDPSWRNIGSFQTLRSAEPASEWRVADLWWANTHLLKMRAISHARGDREIKTGLLRIHQPSRDVDGRPVLTVVDEVPIDPRQGIYAFGVRNPYMPIVLAVHDESGNLNSTDLIPFPSLLRGGLHAAETAAMDTGSLDAVRRLSDAYLAEAVGWGDELLPPSIFEIQIDLLMATGAEAIFEPQLREWLSLVFGVPLSGANVEGRLAADLGDRAFVDYAETLFRQNAPTRRRNGHLRMFLPSCAIPAVGALVSRRLSADRPTAAAPCLIVDACFPDRRFYLSPPAELPNALQAKIPAQQSALPLLSSLTEAGAAAEESSQPAAILFRDLGPRPREAILYPVPKDAPFILPQTESHCARKISAFVHAGEADIRLLLDSLSRQRTEAALEVFLIVSRTRRIEACRELLAELFPSSGHIVTAASSSNMGAAFNEAAASASGDVFAFMDAGTILHDQRTLATIGQLASLEGVATVGCMQIKPRSTTDGALVFRSAGYFPGRVDFSLAPHLALEEIDCSALLPETIYPVAANSAHFYALSAAAWRQVKGLSLRFPQDGIQIDLALRLAEAGLVNICTTRVSVFSDATSAPNYFHDLPAVHRLDLWRLLPALRSSVTIRSF